MKTDLRIVGAGFGRTGTDSMREALEILGFGPCHHNRVLMEDIAHRRLWADALAKGEMDWDLLLEGYRSCVDWPTAYYWPELLAAFPQAKVILTWRTAESWWASFEKTILRSILEKIESPPLAPSGTVVADYVFAGKPMEAGYCMEVYEKGVAAVKARVPEEILLVHKIGDGWEPLCKFLGVDVPDVSYPRSNSAEEFRRWVRY